MFSAFLPGGHSVQNVDALVPLLFQIRKSDGRYTTALTVEREGSAEASFDFDLRPESRIAEVIAALAVSLVLLRSTDEDNYAHDSYHAGGWGDAVRAWQDSFTKAIARITQPTTASKTRNFFRTPSVVMKSEGVQSNAACRIHRKLHRTKPD